MPPRMSSHGCGSLSVSVRAPVCVCVCMCVYSTRVSAALLAQCCPARLSPCRAPSLAMPVCLPPLPARLPGCLPGLPGCPGLAWGPAVFPGCLSGFPPPLPLWGACLAPCLASPVCLPASARSGNLALPVPLPGLRPRQAGSPRELGPSLRLESKGPTLGPGAGTLFWCEKSGPNRGR